MPGTQVLQICPHDAAPFDHICAMYVKACQALNQDLEVTTVFIGSRTSNLIEGARYLDIEDLSDTRKIVSRLREFDDIPWELVVCHRYRSYWAVARSNIKARLTIAVAHEFGMLSRWQRRIGRILFARNIVFAGVSEPVTTELAGIVGEAETLPNVIELDAGTLLNRSQACERLGLSSVSLNIGVVGRLHYKKRPQLAYDAFVEYRAIRAVADLDVPAGVKAKLVFVGDGPQRADVEGKPDVVCCGNIMNAAETFSAFDVLLHTGDKDAFGLVVIEAMRAGVPVVTSRGLGPEYVLGELGYYAQVDTAEGYAHALNQALGPKHDSPAVGTGTVFSEEGGASVPSSQAEYPQMAMRRLRQHFSVDALAYRLDELLALHG